MRVGHPFQRHRFSVTGILVYLLAAIILTQLSNIHTWVTDEAIPAPGYLFDGPMVRWFDTFHQTSGPLRVSDILYWGLGLAGVVFLKELLWSTSLSVPSQPAPSLRRHWTWWNVLGSFGRGQLWGLAVSTAAILLLYPTANDFLHYAIQIIVLGYPCFYMLRTLTPGVRSMVRYFGMRWDTLRSPVVLKLVLAANTLSILFFLGLSFVWDCWKGGVPPPSGSLEGASIATLAFTLVISVLIAPFAEELMFRGFMETGLRPRLGAWGAAILTAAIFSMYRPAQPFDRVYFFGFSLILSLLRAKSGGLAGSIMLHALHNAVSMLYSCGEDVPDL